MNLLKKLLIVLITQNFWQNLASATITFTVLDWVCNWVGFKYGGIEPQFIVLFAYFFALNNMDK